MKLESVTITASASSNYQKYEVAFTVTNLSNPSKDLSNIKNIAINQAIDGVNKMVEKVGGDIIATKPTVEVKTRTNATPRQNNYNQPKSVSEKQRAILLKNGYVNEQIDQMNSKQASAAIKTIFGGR